MTKIFTFLIIISLALVSFSCASKRFTRKAAKMEQAGLYEQAANYYLKAFTKKNTNIDAMAGLKRTAQLVLDKKLSNFGKSYNASENEKAVYFYLDADRYHKKIEKAGVNLNFPEYYREYYSEVKSIYLEDQYVEAISLLEAEKFHEAEKLFLEIIELQPNYKDSNEHLSVAIYEPIYREGERNMDNKKFRTAYYNFDRIINELGRYKDADDLHAYCLDKATITLSIAPLEYPNQYEKTMGSLEAKIIQKIHDLDNPFLRIVEYEQNPRSTHVSSQQEVSMGSSSKYNMPDVVLYCTVNNFTHNKGSLKKEEKRGFLRKKVKLKDAEGNTYTATEYDKVKYYELKMGRSISMSFSYKLTNNRTNELHLANNETLTSSDRIHYADYQGDTKKLVPGYWKSQTSSSPEDVINDNSRSLKSLEGLLSARRVIKTTSTLEVELLDAVSTQIARTIDEYDPDK